jgi:hypothetical protein
VTKSTDKFHSRASLATYSIKQYALENVQRVKRGFLFKKEVSQDVVMSHSSDTTLTTPLSVRVPSELGAAAVHCFRNVTAFMGERKSKRPKLSHAQVCVCVYHMLRIRVYIYIYIYICVRCTATLGAH